MSSKMAEANLRIVINPNDLESVQLWAATMTAENERLRGEVARLQSERDAEREVSSQVVQQIRANYETEMRSSADEWRKVTLAERGRAETAEAELSRVRAEVTAAKADARQIQVETLMAARDAARADWRLVVGPPESKEIYDENQASHFSGMAGWLKHRADKIAAGQEPDWPDSSSAVIGPLDELTPESDAKLRARNAAIFADNQRLGEANERLAHELSRVRAEVTAAKADALEQAANKAQYDPELAHVNIASLQRWLRKRAADTRAELGDS